MAGSSPRLSDAIDEYLVSLKARRRAATTIRNSRSILDMLLREVGNVPTKSLEPRHIDMLMRAKTDVWSDSTTATMVSQLRSFERWLGSRSYLPRSRELTAGYTLIKAPPGHRLRVPVAQFPALLDAADHPRDRMVLAIGLYLFLRASEIRLLLWQDVDLAAGEIRVSIPKTKDSDTMPICLELDMELRRWRRWVTEHLGREPEPDMYLAPAKSPAPAIILNGKLAGQRGEPELRPYKILDKPERCVARALEALGYTKENDEPRMGVHTLRRSGARALFDVLRNQGYDGALKRVSAMLHHKNTAMTEHYLGLDIERTQRNDMLRGEIMFPIADQPDVVNLVPDTTKEGHGRVHATGGVAAERA